MRIFIAGAGGAIGRRLVPMLVDGGHHVVGTTRSPGGAGTVRDMGAEAVVVDALDKKAILDAVVEAEPEVVISQLTALGGPTDLRNFDRSFAATNELRQRGTDLLLAAAVEAGARRYLAQSYTGWSNPRHGGAVKTEADGLDPAPEPRTRESLAAIAHLERVVTDATDIEGLALRYGMIYGTGTAFGHGGEIVEAVAKRKMPIVGNGAGVWSFVHVDDAAAATVAALDRGAPGVYNIVDDEPAPVSEWLPALADAIGAKPPRRVPVWLVRPMLGSHGVSLMTQVRGASNARAKRDLEWAPQVPTWREGFRQGL